MGGRLYLFLYRLFRIETHNPLIPFSLLQFCLDTFATAARVLALAMGGASRTRIVSLQPQIRQGDIAWLLGYLVEKKLLEIDSSGAYWTTVEGVKFLEIQFQMERILKAVSPLV